ncbi:MAG: YceI family protein [Campylobacterota bacterium]|nr:YceI family protein [Campylobacterota bacterium]
MKKILLSLGALLSIAHSEGCLLVQDNTMNVKWDAYKTDSRITVHGKFTDVTYTPKALEGKSFKELLVGSKVNMDGIKIDTEIISRDETIVEFFFNKLTTAKIEGIITDIKADERIKGKPRTGIVTVEITFNGKSKAIPMNYNYYKEDFSATGSMNLADFSALDALASIDKSCHDLYKGKIWSDVTIKFNTKIKATLCDVEIKKEK